MGCHPRIPRERTRRPLVCAEWRRGVVDHRLAHHVYLHIWSWCRHRRRMDMEGEGVERCSNKGADKCRGGRQREEGGLIVGVEKFLVTHSLCCTYMYKTDRFSTFSVRRYKIQHDLEFS